MTIPSFRILKKNARERVAASANAGPVVLVYSGIVTALAILVTVANFVLNDQIAQTGGLSNMGLRSMLSTIQSVIPMIQSAALMFLEMGYLAAMLRVSRSQYTSEKTLYLGFDRFWLLLRTTLLQAGIYMGMCMAALWISAQIFMFTPFSAAFSEAIYAVGGDAGFAAELLLDEAVYQQLMVAMIPMFIIFGVVYTALCLPLSYSFRMVNYIIIDKPALTGMAVLKESRKMMRGSRMRLFKLDVSLWWWYLMSVVLFLICYGDVLLPMAGISLPLSEDVSYYLFYALFLISQFAVFYFLRNRVEVIYAQVYDALKPREKQEGVVLGNIFQM